MHLNSIYRESFHGHHNPFLARTPYLKPLAKEGVNVSRGSSSIPTHLLGNKEEVLSPPGKKPVECWYLKPTAASCVYGWFRFAGGGEGNQNSI